VGGAGLIKKTYSRQSQSSRKERSNVSSRTNNPELWTSQEERRLEEKI